MKHYRNFLTTDVLQTRQWNGRFTELRMVRILCCHLRVQRHHSYSSGVDSLILLRLSRCLISLLRFPNRLNLQVKCSLCPIGSVLCAIRWLLVKSGHPGEHFTQTIKTNIYIKCFEKFNRQKNILK